MSARTLLTAVFLLAGCAHQDAPISQCKGASRPANPHGSVLEHASPIPTLPAPSNDAGGCV